MRNGNYSYPLDTRFPFDCHSSNNVYFRINKNTVQIPQNKDSQFSINNYVSGRHAW